MGESFTVILPPHLGHRSGVFLALSIAPRFSALFPLNMITVDLARELARDNISCVAVSHGWVKTKMTGFTGEMEVPEAVERMIKLIDGLKPSDTATFYHRDGCRLPW